MSLPPSPTTAAISASASASASTSAASGQRWNMTAAELEQWDAPIIALAQKSQGDLRKLLFHFFSFLHRRTDFYMIHDKASNAASANAGGGMGFQEGDAEKLLLAAFRQFPLRRIPSKPNPYSQSQSKSQSKSQANTQMQKQTEAKAKANVKPTPHTNSNDTKSSVPNTKSSTTKNEQKAVKTGDDNDNDKAEETSPKSTNHDSNPKNTNSDNKQKKADSGNKDVHIKYTTDKNGNQVQIPQEGNGGTSLHFGFQWTQTIQEASIAFPLPIQDTTTNTDIRAKDLNIVIKSNSITISLKQQSNRPPLLHGQLTNRIRPDESTWTLESNGILLLTLEKYTPTWWNSILQLPEETNSKNTNTKETIDTSLIETKRHIDTYDNATQAMIRKIMFDQNQQRLGLPSSQEILHETEYQKRHNDNSSSEPKRGTVEGEEEEEKRKEREKRAMIEQLPPGVEYIDKSNFPPNAKS